MNGNLTHLRAENIAFNSDKVAYVKQFFYYGVIKLLVFARTKVVAADIHLYATL